MISRGWEKDPSKRPELDEFERIEEGIVKLNKK